MEKKFEREFIADLACFMQGYVKEIQEHLISEAENIAANPMICQLLHEYRVRREKAEAEFLSNVEYRLNYGTEIELSESCLNHSGSYHDVLADLLVNEWWHEQCGGKRGA